MLLKISQNSQENTYQRLFFNKIVGLRPVTLTKAQVQVFSCKFCEIFRNNFLYRTPPLVASVFYSET